MNCRGIRLQQVGALLSLWVGLHATCAQCTDYDVTVLEGLYCPLWGQSAGSSAISQNGSVCGETADCGQAYVLVWTGGPSYATFSWPDGTKGLSPYAMNDQLHVVGYWHPESSPERAFQIVNGVFSDLPPLANDNQATAYAILNDGRIAGFSGGCNPSCRIHAVVWTNGVAEALTLPMGPSAIAYDISDAGFVCGWMGIDPSPAFGAHAFIWRDGEVNDLGVPLTGSVTTEARAVNNLGQACGIATYPDETKNPFSFWRRGFFWSEGVMQDIGTLPGYPEAYALDINDRAEIIGYCDGPSIAPRAFIWRNGVMTALNDLLPPGFDLNVVDAVGINNQGQIAASAWNATDDSVAVIFAPRPKRPGDFNCDAIVDLADLLAVIGSWHYAINSPADFNADGIVNVPDLLIVIQNWTR